MWMVVFGCAWVVLVLGKCVWLLVGYLKVGRFVCGWVWFWVGDFLAKVKALKEKLEWGVYAHENGFVVMIKTTGRIL